MKAQWKLGDVWVVERERWVGSLGVEYVKVETFKDLDLNRSSGTFTIPAKLMGPAWVKIQ